MAKLTLLTLCVASALVPGIASAQVKSCKTATLVYGNPDYKAGERPASGTSAKADPPLAWRHMTFSDKNVYTSTGQEIWAVDLATGTQRLVAGQQQKSLPALADGPCANARFANTQGITRLPDGSLVVADAQSNSVLQIANPDDAGKCAVTFLAGTNKATSPVSQMTSADKDGPVGTSALGKPMWPVADDAGNVYFIDSDSSKLKKIAPDAAHTVSTLGPMPKDNGIDMYRGMTIIKDKLYAVSNNFRTGFIFEIDTASGKARQVIAAEGKNLPEIGGASAAAFSSIATDGKDLFVTGSGFIWRVTTAGKSSFVAGNGAPLDWPKGYDPAAPQKAKDVLLRYRIADQTALGSTAALAYNDGSLYFRGKNYSTFVLKIDCK